MEQTQENTEMFAKCTVSTAAQHINSLLFITYKVCQTDKTYKYYEENAEHWCYTVNLQTQFRFSYTIMQHPHRVWDNRIALFWQTVKQLSYWVLTTSWCYWNRAITRFIKYSEWCLQLVHVMSTAHHDGTVTELLQGSLSTVSDVCSLCTWCQRHIMMVLSQGYYQVH